MPSHCWAQQLAGSLAILYTYSTCPVQKFGHVGTDPLEARKVRIFKTRYFIKVTRDLSLSGVLGHEDQVLGGRDKSGP